MKSSDALLFPAIVHAATGGAYDFAMREIMKGSKTKKRGNLIACHVCGRSWVTLYKDGDKRICAECKREAMP